MCKENKHMHTEVATVSSRVFHWHSIFQIYFLEYYLSEAFLRFLFHLVMGRLNFWQLNNTNKKTIEDGAPLRIAFQENGLSFRKPPIDRFLIYDAINDRLLLY